MKKFNVIEESGILYACFWGETYIHDFEDYLKHISQMDLPARIKILQDHRTAISSLQPSKIEELTGLYEKYLGDKEEVKIAYINQNPNGIALAILFKSQIKSTKIKVKVFSEKENALDWLLF
jgi:hypothetical protein